MTLLHKKPGVFAVLIIALAVIVCSALGVWQMQRREWKHELIETIDARIGAEPVPLPVAIDDPKAWDYRRVTVTGTFDHTKESYLQAQSRHGNFGYQVITPLTRPDGSMVLINRGWVPYEDRDPAARPEGQVEGPVTITGIVRLPWERTAIAKYFGIDNDPVRKIFFDAKLDEMAAAHGISVLPVFVDADGTENPGGFPIGGQTVLKINDPHLSYAIQWFALAITALVIFVLYHRRKDT